MTLCLGSSVNACARERERVEEAEETEETEERRMTGRFQSRLDKS